MKNASFAFIALAILFAASCGKDKPDTPTTTTDPTQKGPWDGTYTMVSVTTYSEDTSDYIPYGGNERVMEKSFRGDTATSGTIVITKDSIRHQNIFINRLDTAQTFTYNKNTGQTTSNGNYRSYGQVSANASNTKSKYTIAGADSVTIDLVSVVPFPFATYNSNYPKFRYTYDGTYLTIYNDYRVNEVSTTTPTYNHRAHHVAVARYRKQ